MKGSGSKPGGYFPALADTPAGDPHAVSAAGACGRSKASRGSGVPAYWYGDAARRAANARTRAIAATTRRPISNRLPSPSDRPKCEKSAARPSPAASPAIGPSQRDPREAVFAAAAAPGAVRVAAAPGVAGITGRSAGPANAGFDG